MKIYTSDDTQRNEDIYAVLIKDSWDDYGVQAAFDFYLFIKGKKRHIGEVKIIAENKTSGRVAIKDGISLLPTTFCSLGQSPDYYNALRRLGSKIENQVLTAFRDCAYDPQIYEDFKDLTYFTTSLIRFTRAEQALQYARNLYSSVAGPAQKASYSFDFKTKLPGFKAVHTISFEFFDPTSFKIPSNINVVIGRNGTGKTQILSDLAKAISGYGYDDQDELIDARTKKFPTGRPNFGNTIVVSYSAFDMFEIPGKTRKEINELEKEGHIFGYKYCGLRERTRKGEYKIKSSEEVASEFMEAIDSIEDRGAKKDWENCLEHILSDPSFSSVNLDTLRSQFRKLSSGQKIILSILAKIVEHIEPTSIVIIDEPETHLHPSLMAAFMHALRTVLTKYDSYAIVATHSPVILQETPSRFVQVLSGTPNRPVVKSLSLESFGEEISTLTEEVFGLSFEEANFYTVLRNLSSDGMSNEEINILFGKKLGLTARSFLIESTE
ncbi:AAA family ATPase [Janthinobacterium sp. NKUCC06_STL]|uniref:AAA family ATPase n=1 Tax=Janthinobacterium sp. NKUCC06_STL TaxID=2842127 RepID=UPI001C5B0CDB|nr:AAA family ATPase [Janthinobacterium sp. NKUCC06_STL]MBW3510604.1 ATP-binding protein [Janthinobacterium sp. NKUCC06_STL]